MTVRFIAPAETGATFRLTIIMNRRHLLASLVLAVVAAAATVHLRAEDTPHPLRVLTYNIHHGEGEDKRVDLARIAAIIAASGADLVALQELDQKTKRTNGIDEAAELAALTGLNYTFGKAMDYQGGAYGQCLLSRWPLEDIQVHQLPNPLKTPEPRIAVSAVVHPPGMKAIRFAGTHLDAIKDDQGRWQQAAKLIEFFARDETPTILMGDFNSTPDSRAMKALLGSFTDASAATPAFTIPSPKPKSRIDFVLLHPAGIWRTLSSSVLVETVASDHRPVLVELLPADGR